MKRRLSWLSRLARPARIFLPALAIGLVGCAPTVSVPSDLLPTPPAELPDLGGRTVTVGVPADNLPYIRIDPVTGAVEGFDFELITMMAARLNATPQFRATDPATLLADLGAGRLDLAGGGIAYTLARATQFDFTAPYALVKLRLAVRTDENRAATIAAFRERAVLRVGTMRGIRTFELTVDFFGAERVDGFDTISAAVDALVAGAVDGVALDDPDLVREQARLPASLVSLPGPLGGDVAAYALPLGSDLTDPFDGAFLQLQAEGAIAALREKWGL
jgi:ABC-type amino acid transport substrate-binding protein